MGFVADLLGELEQRTGFDLGDLEVVIVDYLALLEGAPWYDDIHDARYSVLDVLRDRLDLAPLDENELGAAAISLAAVQQVLADPPEDEAQLHIDLLVCALPLEQVIVSRLTEDELTQFEAAMTLILLPCIGIPTETIVAWLETDTEVASTISQALALLP